MSLIGSLEQFDLANILRRLEVFSKTGLLVVKQKDQWVEFYFRQGQLVCVGPTRANTTLIDRLLRANLLSLQALPQVMAAVGPSELNETRLALALINEGYLSREILRAWSSHETSQLLGTLLGWTAGEVYFEEDCPTPADRLLVALSISALLETMSVPAAPSTSELSEAPAGPTPAQPTLVTPALADKEPGKQMNPTKVEQVASFTAPAPASDTFSQTSSGNGVASNLISAAQLIEDFPFSPSGSLNGSPLLENTPSPTFAAAAPPMPVLGSEIDISAPAQVSLVPPQPVHNPLPPARIDVSFMTPELVPVPVDLSSLRERNPQVQLTPDQWRLFALIDGQASLQALCQMLMAPAEQVCMVAGELMAIGLVIVPALAGLAMQNGMAPSGQYAALPSRGAPQPVAAASAYPSMQGGTQAQWGNGNNGAVFMAGGGWMFPAQQAAFQPAQGQPSAAYASIGGYR